MIFRKRLNPQDEWKRFQVLHNLVCSMHMFHGWTRERRRKDRRQRKRQVDRPSLDTELSEAMRPKKLCFLALVQRRLSCMFLQHLLVAQYWLQPRIDEFFHVDFESNIWKFPLGISGLPLCQT